MENKTLEIIINKISNCKGCNNNCSCKDLTAYIDKIGMDEFTRKYNDNSLPENIRTIYDSKKKELKL